MKLGYLTMWKLFLPFKLHVGETETAKRFFGKRFLFSSYFILELCQRLKDFASELKTLSCYYSSVCSYSGGSEELSDDITQQQLLPGVKYVNTRPPVSIKTPAEMMKICRLWSCLNVKICLSSSGIPICGRSSARCVFTQITHIITTTKHNCAESYTHTFPQHILSFQIGEERATAIALMRKFIAYQFTDTVKHYVSFECSALIGQWGWTLVFVISEWQSSFHN